MIKIKNTFGIILLLLLTINLSCTQEEVVELKKEEKVDLKSLESKLKAFLENNQGLTSGRQEIGGIDEIVNDFLNDELQAGDVTIVSGNGSSAGNSGSNNSSSQNFYTMIYRFQKYHDHFYTTSYQEGIDAGYSFQGLLGMAKREASSIFSTALVRWYTTRHGDRVISNGVVDGDNHPVIAGDTFNQWRPDGVHTPYVPFDGTYLGRSILAPQFPTRSSGTWQFEGVMGYSGGSTPIFGYYNHALKDHLYTNDINELGTGGNGYVSEGVAFTLR